MLQCVVKTINVMRTVAMIGNQCKITESGHRRRRMILDERFKSLLNIVLHYLLYPVDNKVRISRSRG